MFNFHSRSNQVKTMLVLIASSSVVIVGFTRLNFPLVKTLLTENNVNRMSFINRSNMSNKNTSTVFALKSDKVTNNDVLKESLLNHSAINFRNNSNVKHMYVSVYKIGILIPSTTRNIKNPSLNKLSLINKCIPSIFKFIEKKYNFLIYIGVDKGDYLETVKHNLETMFDKIKVVVTIGGSFTKTANAIAREAYTDGMDYLVRINDDTTFETNNWTSQGIKVLQNFSPPNIGVVGPTCRQGNTAILTHDMVHRTHLEIFDFYYPPYFDNWWSDDWITRVYQPNRSTKLNTWVVKHHLSAHNTRYKVDLKQHSRLDKTLMFDLERLSKYLESHNRSRPTL